MSENKSGRPGAFSTTCLVWCGNFRQLWPQVWPGTANPASTPCTLLLTHKSVLALSLPGLALLFKHPDLTGSSKRLNFQCYHMSASVEVLIFAFKLKPCIWDICPLAEQGLLSSWPCRRSRATWRGCLTRTWTTWSGNNQIKTDACHLKFQYTLCPILLHWWFLGEFATTKIKRQNTSRRALRKSSRSLGSTIFQWRWWLFVAL